MKELQANHTYLLQFAGMVSSVTVLMITDKAYRIRWNDRITENKITWELKTAIGSTHSVIEDISDFPIKDVIEDVRTNTKLKTCPICHGFGTIPDESSTGGTTTCPLCHGSKMIPETVEL